MRAVKGTVTSTRRVSVSKAAGIMGRFEAGAATGARPDVAAYLRRASAAFNELAQVHKKLRDEHRIPRIEFNGGEEEEAEKDEKVKKKKEKKEKRNPSVQEMDDEKWRSSDLEGGTGSFGVKDEGFEENRRKKERRELEENGFVLEVGKKKKKKKEKKQKNLDENGVAEEERSDFDGKSEEMVVDGTKKKKDKNVDKDSENLEEGAQSEFMESHERRDERELRKKKKEKKRRNFEEEGTGSELDRVGLDGDWKKRKHSDDGVVDERELHKKKKRKTKEQDT